MSTTSINYNMAAAAPGGGPPNAKAVMIKRTTIEPFARQFRVAANPESRPEHTFLANQPFPIYSGLDVETQHPDMRAGEERWDWHPGVTEAQTPINFATMCDMDGALKDAILELNDRHPEHMPENDVLRRSTESRYEGTAASQGDEHGAPVSVELMAGENGAASDITVTVTADFEALAKANYAERIRVREENPESFANVRPLQPIIPGDPLPMEAQRMPVSVKYPVRKHGVPGFTTSQIHENTVKAAAQGYLMTSSKKHPDRNVPGKKDVDRSVQIVDRCFKQVIEMGKTGCRGIRRMGPDGKPTDAVIPGTSFPSFQHMGIVPRLDKETGGIFLTVPDDTAPVTATIRRSGLDGMGRAMGALLSQAAGGLDREKSRNVRNLVYATKFEFYEARPRIPGREWDTVASTVAPAMRMEFTPFASAVRDSVKAATRIKTPEEVYGKEVLANAVRVMADGGIETDPKKLGRGATDADRTAAMKDMTALATRIGLLRDDLPGGPGDGVEPSLG